MTAEEIENALIVFSTYKPGNAPTEEQRKAMITILNAAWSYLMTLEKGS